MKTRRGSGRDIGNLLLRLSCSNVLIAAKVTLLSEVYFGRSSMRFHVGPIPIEFTPDDTWRPLKEPSPAMLQVFAVPVGVAVAAAVGYGWVLLGLPLSTSIDGKTAPLAVVGALLSIPLLIIVH